MQNEVKVLKYINSKNIDVPIPEIKHADFSKNLVPFGFVVMNLIPGLTLKEYVNKKEHSKDVFKELGMIKGKINSLRDKKYGDFTKQNTDSYSTVLKEEWNKLKVKLIKSKLNKVWFVEQDDFFNKNIALTEKDVGPCLVHGDTSLNNVLVKDGKVSGILDFEYAKFGCGIHDLFSSVKGFNIIFSNRNELINGYSKYVDVPNEWEKLMYFYQWFANIKALSHVKKMSWRDLDKKETYERKKSLRKKYKVNCKKHVTSFYDINGG